MSTSATFVGIKEFRNNMNSYIKKARHKGTSIVVMKHSEPLFEVFPCEEGETIDNLVEALAEAREDVKHGRVHSHDDVVEVLKRKIRGKT